MQLVKVASASQVVEGQVLPVEALGHDIILTRVEGRICAIDAVCNHQNGALENGEIEGRLITCPIHQAVFDLTTGKVSPDTPWANDQTCFAVTVQGDDVFVSVP
ncbi:MAG TPA: Rieske 2Fe-2S domain-containing protein [Candidatus Bathyarchaeia archaeon]|nr:Rieske 2Fe-2S domain-containing protein [Candidatus Bathyarchaeia archaeon]